MRPTVLLRAVLALSLLSGCGYLRPKPETLVLAAGQPLVQVAVPSVKAQAVFSRIAQNGDVETFSAATPVTISLRGGLLVATRGMGADVMAVDTGPTARALAAGGQGAPYRRKMRLLDGENHSDYLYASCEMVALGRDGSGLSRFEERCASRAGAHINLYSRDSLGQLRSSQQWGGPQLGYLTITALPN